MNDHYLLPSEFALLLAFWFGLPLLVSFAILGPLFVNRGLFRYRPWRAFGALGLSVVLSVVLGLGALVLSPSLPRFLGVQDVFLAGLYLPVLPLSFVVVAIVSATTAWWALRAVGPKTAVKRDAPRALRPLP
jgi:hypothetical protein